MTSPASPTGRRTCPSPAFLAALSTLIRRVDKALAEYRGPAIDLYMGGGAAAHVYTFRPFPDDVDLAVGRRILLPADVSVRCTDETGRDRMLRLDRHTPFFLGLLHEQALEDARWMEIPKVSAERLRLRILTPVDLAVSKLARYSTADQADIAALATAGLLPIEEFRTRAREAIFEYIGRVNDARRAMDAAATLIEAKSPPAKSQAEELVALTESIDENSGPGLTFTQILATGVPHAGGLAQLAQAEQAADAARKARPAPRRPAKRPVPKATLPKKSRARAKRT